MDKKSYALGMSVAENMKHAGIKNLSVEDFTSAVDAIMTGKETALKPEEAGDVLNELFAALQAEQNAKAAEEGAIMKEAGEKFLKAKAAEEGVVTLPSGLMYKVIEEGNGKKPGATDQVKCHYEGTFIDGTKFDSSYDRKSPAVFGVNQVIKGWVEALQLMGEGSKWELYIPYNLAYGEAGAQGAIPPYSTLVFTVELIEVL